MSGYPKRHLKPDTEETAPLDWHPVGEGLSLDVQATLLSFPGPALLVNQHCDVVGMNKPGEVISALMARSGSVPGVEALRIAIREAILLGMPTEARLDVFEEGAEPKRRTFDLSLLPLQKSPDDAHMVFVLGREMTLETSLIEALVRSRELYQDVIKCSSDFAWETDEAGIFTFVSTKSNSGFTTEKLSGTRAFDLIDQAKSPVGSDFFPFLVQFPIEDFEVWLTATDGSSKCMLMTAVPVHDENGEFKGSRGACVDVTELRANEFLLREARRRENLVDRIVGTIRAELDPMGMLRTAALEIGDVLRADFGCLFLWQEDGEAFTLGASTAPEAQTPSSTDQGLVNRVLADLDRHTLVDHNDALQVLEKSFHGDKVLLCGTTSNGKINGVLMMTRGADEAPWSVEDKVLLHHIASHMGIVLAQAAHAEKLEALSRRDPMTGLLNRRAFFQEARVCLARNERSGLSVTYIYFDLDNFKQVNDTLGHGVGDELLNRFADTLSALTREGDLAVRLGGDEFGLLLDNCEPRAAAQKVEMVVNELRGIVQELGVPDTVSVSAGIAGWTPGEDQTIDQVLDRADRVLYDAKHAGKSGWCIAGSAAKATDKEKGYA